MFVINIVEGNTRPKELPSDPRTKKTTNLLFHLCKSLYSVGKVVRLGSGFCVLEGLIELIKVGVFADDIIKKRRYWPKHTKGDMIDTHFQDKEVGRIYSWNVALNDTPYDVLCIKEPDYFMKIMTTYGEHTFPEGQRQSTRVVQKDNGSTKINKFQYAVPFAYHFYYRRIVDDHNGLRHMYPSLEQIWVTHC